ncbi:hypothetical protein FJ365_01620 [Candidatus Dependentiae bacterium]|nr:hypothetical protein [Candidatus Dependentiae bacterium]
MNIFLICCSLACIGLRAEEFIVQPKAPPVSKQKLSRSALKENLGSVAKELFSETTGLVKRIGASIQGLAETQQSVEEQKQQQAITVAVPRGTLQRMAKMHEDVAYLQTTCARLAEGLLDDEPRVTKATKVALNTALHIMQDALAAVKKCELGSSTGEQDEKGLREIIHRIKNDGCLRHS